MRLVVLREAQVSKLRHICVRVASRAHSRDRARGSPKVSQPRKPTARRARLNLPAQARRSARLARMRPRGWAPRGASWSAPLAFARPPRCPARQAPEGRACLPTQRWCPAHQGPSPQAKRCTAHREPPPRAQACARRQKRDPSLRLPPALTQGAAPVLGWTDPTLNTHTRRSERSRHPSGGGHQPALQIRAASGIAPCSARRRLAALPPPPAPGLAVPARCQPQRPTWKRRLGRHPSHCRSAP